MLPTQWHDLASSTLFAARSSSYFKFAAKATGGAIALAQGSIAIIGKSSYHIDTANVVFM
jgi:hypothetical protein